MRLTTEKDHTELTAVNSEWLLRVTGVVFAVALLVHGADHARRGIGELSPAVFWLGTAQTVGALTALFLVFTRNRWAPVAAIVVGFASAVGFTVVHVVPDWGPLSDAFPGAHGQAEVTAFSWFAALFEIGADVAFGTAGVLMLGAGPMASRGPLEAGSGLRG